MRRLNFTSFAKELSLNSLELDAPIFIEFDKGMDIDQLKKFASDHHIDFSEPLKNQALELKEVYQAGRLEHLKSIDHFFHGDGSLAQNFRGELIFINWGRTTIFHVLPQELFYELITWRNKEKLNDHEQALISKARVAVVGSSVGSFATKVLVKSGFQHLNLAEIKNMKPSNSPRMYMDSLRNYGGHKLTPLIESIYEFNPYCQVSPYYDGLHSKNAHQFFTPNGKNVDLVIDAADDPGTKVLIRDYCKRLKIPMITGFDEKGCLIIDRYDQAHLELSQAPNFDIDALKKLKSSDPKQYINKLLDYFPEGGYENLSERQKLTIAGILKGTNGGFSQLAWEAALFSSYVTKAAIDVILGKNVHGHQFIDLDLLISRNMHLTKIDKAS